VVATAIVAEFDKFDQILSFNDSQTSGKAVDVVAIALTARHRAPYNANRALAALRKMLSLAVKEWELCDENQALGIKLFRETKRERFVTDNELRKIGRWLAESEREGTEVAAAIKLTRLLAFTGMRLSEVRTLEWSSVDAEAGVVRLSDGKTGARLVPIGTQARMLLGSDSREGRFVIADGEDAPLSVRKFRTFWSHLRKGTGVSEIRPHDLRHTVGTFAAQAGANAFLVRDLLGHKTLAMTGRYVGRSADPVRALADQVNARVASAMSGLPTAKVVQLKRHRRCNFRTTPGLARTRAEIRKAVESGAAGVGASCRAKRGAPTSDGTKTLKPPTLIIPWPEFSLVIRVKTRPGHSAERLARRPWLG